MHLFGPRTGTSQDGVQESIIVGAAVTLEEVINLLASIKGPASSGYTAMVEHMERIAGTPQTQTPGPTRLYVGWYVAGCSCQL